MDAKNKNRLKKPGAQMAPSPWLTVEKVAQYVSVSPGTVRNWVSQKDIPQARRGRVLRFHRQRIDEWLVTGGCPDRATIAQKILPSNFCSTQS